MPFPPPATLCSKLRSALGCAWAVLFLGISLAASAPAQDARQVSGGVVLDGVPATPSSLAERMHPWRAVRTARFVDWAEDGILVATRFAETEQFHRVASPLAAREQVTFLPDGVAGGASGRSGNPGLHLFESLRGGGGLPALGLLALPSQTVVPVETQGRSSRAAVWSRTGTRYAFSCRSADRTRWEVMLADVDAPTSPPVVALSEPGIWTPLDWSPDDSSLLVREDLSEAHSRLSIIELATRTRTPVDSGDVKAAWSEGLFSMSGRGLYVVTDIEGGPLRLRYHDLEHDVSKVLADGVTGDVENLALSADGRWLAFTERASGLHRLHVLDTETLGLLTPPMPAANLADLRFHPSKPLLGLTLKPQTQPADAFVLEIPSGSLAPWTDSEVGPNHVSPFIAPESVAIRTEDKDEKGQQRRLPGWLWRPRATAPAPVLIVLPDGPGGHAEPAFDPFLQFLACEMGIAVLVPEVRGSAGNGRAWRMLDDGPSRAEVLRDITAVLDWIQAQPALDSSRVATLGVGGYGGYLSLMAQVREGARLRAGVALNPISDLPSWLASLPPDLQPFEREEFGDERVEAVRTALAELSPLTQSGRIANPMLLAHGNNNPRVPWTQSESLVKALRADGRTPWFLVALDEGAAFHDADNREVWERTCAHFLQMHLLPPSVPGGAL